MTCPADSTALVPLANALRILVVVVLSLFLLNACGGGGEDTPDVDTAGGDTVGGDAGGGDTGGTGGQFPVLV